MVAMRVVCTTIGTIGYGFQVKIMSFTKVCPKGLLIDEEAHFYGGTASPMQYFT